MQQTVLRIKRAIVIPIVLGLVMSLAGLQFYGASESFAQTAPAGDSAQQRCDELAGDPRDPSQVGRGVPFAKIQVTEALPACQAATNAAPVQPHYQFLYGRVLQKAERYDEAFQQYNRAAAGGVAGAMHNLGVLYEHGLGVTANDAEAQSWYRKAESARRAEEAKILAANNSSPEREPGSGQAAALDEKGASSETGVQATDLAASAPMASGSDDSQTPDIPHLTADANKGDQTAMLKLGLYYSEQGPSSNDSQAADWFRKAAEAGNPRGMYYHGVMLLHSAESFQAARGPVGLLDQADAENFTYQLAHPGMVRNAPPSLDEARVWFCKGAELGERDSETMCGKFFQTKVGGALDDKQAMQWYAKASLQGSLTAEYAIGSFYKFEAGMAVNHDPEASSRDLESSKALFTKVVADTNPPLVGERNTSFELELEGKSVRDKVRADAQIQLDQIAKWRSQSLSPGEAKAFGVAALLVYLSSGNSQSSSSTSNASETLQQKSDRFRMDQQDEEWQEQQRERNQELNEDFGQQILNENEGH